MRFSFLRFLGLIFFSLSQAYGWEMLIIEDEKLNFYAKRGH